MDFTTVVRTRRSVRSYAQRDIPGEVLGRILDAARLAPSACNTQPWRFIVVRDAATRTKIARAAHDQAFVAAAPVVIACCGRRYPGRYSWIGEGMYLIDLAIAIDHLTLAARAEGVGSCWIGAFEHEPIKRLLAVPADHDVVMLVPLGYPASPDAFRATEDRLALSEVVFAERFGGKPG